MLCLNKKQERVLININTDFFFKRQKKKRVNLSIYLNSENNVNILAPILGQYNIKPLELLTKVNDKFFLNQCFIHEDIKNNLLVPLIVEFSKNTFDIYIKKLYNIYLYNMFKQEIRKRYLDVRLLYKIQLINKNNFVFSLINKIIC